MTPRTPAGRTAAVPADGRAILLNAMTERSWQDQVEAWARRGKWLCYHTHTSLGSAKGFPDCVFARPQTGEIIYAELKTERGKVTAAQQQWIDALAACMQRVFVWRPSDERIVKATLGVAA